MLLYRDEKLKRIIRRESRALWQIASASKERTCWLGGLATLAWIACVIHLPPVQRARSIVPHFVAICAAGSIAGVIKKNFQNATDVQKRTITLANKLKSTQDSDELRNIHRELIQMENQFIIKSYNSRG